MQVWTACNAYGLMEHFTRRPHSGEYEHLFFVSDEMHKALLFYLRATGVDELDVDFIAHQFYFLAQVNSIMHEIYCHMDRPLPNWHPGGLLDRPWARAHLASRRYRAEEASLRLWHWAVSTGAWAHCCRLQPHAAVNGIAPQPRSLAIYVMIPPCSWCGDRTLDSCRDCHPNSCTPVCGACATSILPVCPSCARNLALDADWPRHERGWRKKRLCRRCGI